MATQDYVLQFELTDTFGGEANYAWARRAHMTPPAKDTRRACVKAAKAWAGITNERCRVQDTGDGFAVYPAGSCTVLFITYCERQYAQGEDLTA